MVVMQFMRFAIDTEATFTSTERVRYYIEVSIHRTCIIRNVLLSYCVNVGYMYGVNTAY